MRTGDLLANIALDALCARLCDVAPDGSSRRISYGVINLTHRDSHSEPSALNPGTFYTVRLKLNACGYAIAPGHVVRLALSSAYWPLLWPAPEGAGPHNSLTDVPGLRAGHATLDGAGWLTGVTVVKA